MAHLIAFCLRFKLLLGAFVAAIVSVGFLLHVVSQPHIELRAELCPKVNATLPYFMPPGHVPEAWHCRRAECPRDFEDERNALARGDYEAARVALGKVTARNCGHWTDVMINLAIDQAEFGRYKSSIKTCNAILRREPQNGFAYRNRAFAHEKLGHFTRALRDYDRALKVAPGYVYFVGDRALLLAKHGYETEAMREVYMMMQSEGANPGVVAKVKEICQACGSKASAGNAGNGDVKIPAGHCVAGLIRE